MQVSSPVETTVPERVKITTVVGANSSDPYPMLDCTWDMFAGKGIHLKEIGRTYTEPMLALLP